MFLDTWKEIPAANEIQNNIGTKGFNAGEFRLFCMRVNKKVNLIMRMRTDNCCTNLHTLSIDFDVNASFTFKKYHV